MNGPRRTACFAKEMHSYTLFTLKLYAEVIPEVQPEIIPEKQPEVVPEVLPEVLPEVRTGSCTESYNRKSEPEVVPEVKSRSYTRVHI